MTARYPLVIDSNGRMAELPSGDTVADVVQRAGDTMTGALTLAGDPGAALQAATKQYVDNLVAGLSWKQACVVATTANITLSGEQTIDGVTTSASRVLVKNQTTASQNGIYVSASGSWTRATDMDASAEFPGASVFIESGTVWADTQWVCTNTAAPTVGTTAIVFAQFSSGGGTPGGTSGQVQYNNSGAFGGFTLGGDATLVPSTGILTIAANAVTTTKINNSAVTLAKIANASASSKLLGSGASGSGAPYAEVTLGTGLSMAGTTLSANGVASNIKYTRVQLQSSVTFANNAFAAKSWSSSDIVQDDVGSWASGSPTRFTTPSGYTRVRITLNSTWATNNAGARWTYVIANGAGNVLEQVYLATNEGAQAAVSVWLPVTAGDYFEFNFAQTSGGNLNLTGAAGVLATATRVQIEWMP